MTTDLGHLIDIDLTAGRIQTTAFLPEIATWVLGGLGFGVKTLLESIPVDADPLGPDNVIVISPGLLTGTGAPCSSRLHLCTRSPQSGLIGSSNVGGFFGARLWALSIRGIVLRGRSPTPVFLHLGPGGPTLVCAKSLWGLDTRDTRARLKRMGNDPRLETLIIGAAGENRLPFACVMAGTDHAAGRNGLGAVMGSKNLKALCAEATRRPTPQGAKATALIRDYVASIRSNASRYDDFSTFGSSGDILETQRMGLLGTRNYQSGQIEGAERIDGRHLERFVTKRVSCHKCPVHCKAEIEIQAKRHKGFRGGRPEYETLINMGSLCGLTDPEEVVYLSNLCNILGMDTISTGSVIAFAMDLFQRGILSEADTDGLDLSWGNADAMETIMGRMARREGFGAVLSDGVEKAAERIGKGAERYAYHVKGVEMYGADPRGLHGTALAYAVSFRGADFTSVYPVPEFRYTPEKAFEAFGTPKAVDFSATEGKGAMIRFCMIVSAVLDSLGLCKVAALSVGSHFDLEREAKLATVFSGIGFTAEALMTIGERIVNMEKQFNLRCGAGRASDTLPAKFTQERIAKGPAKGARLRLAPMVADFYRCMGWDDLGVPTAATLRRLGIGGGGDG